MPIDNYELIDRLKKSDLRDYNNLNMLFEMCRNILTIDREYALKTCSFVKHKAAAYCIKEPRFYDLYNKCLLFRAHDCFDDYLLYMEKDREPEKRFYLSRRKILKTLVDDLQDLEDGVIEFLGVSLPTRTGKSTLCIFFMSWVMAVVQIKQI
jgi:hypothetical protein